jgi:2-desacetyl-2-hydroxyethyl bacteriochlorophyllide A dehydrogenase
MKAAIYPGQGQALEIQEISEPKPSSSDIVIKVHRCGICGTDLHMTEGHSWQFPANCTPGHEFSGEIIELGSDVKNISIGDLITALPSTGCGKCIACHAGNFVLCHKGPGVLGGFAEYMSIPSQVALKLPTHLNAADGALIEPLAVGLYGVRTAKLKKNDNVLIMGAGSVALCTAFWAKHLGAKKVVILSRSEWRRSMALNIGVDAVVVQSENTEEELNQHFAGNADIVFECIGQPNQLMHAVKYVRVLGKVVSLGFCTQADPIIPAVTGYKGVSMYFPVGYTLQDFQYAADILDKGEVDPKIMISSTHPLTDIASVFSLLRGTNRETKVHISPLL